MKIFLPFKINNIGGGTSMFAKKFKEGMERRGHEVFFEYRPDYDILLMIVQAPFKYLFEAKRRKKKIIQRLDGAYYWSTVGPRYFLYNLKAKIIRHFFTDFTIYQSKYCKYCADKFLGRKKHDNYTIIYNGVDLNSFSPEGEKIELRNNPEQKIFFTVSVFRRKEQIVPILKALKIYRDKYDNNFKFIIAGAFMPEVSHIIEKYSDFKNIIFLGNLNNNTVPQYERASDVFLFTQLNPSCPNNVIESLACGLPICGVADGSMLEIIENDKNGLLLPAKGDAFWRMRQYNPEMFADNLNRIVKNRQNFSDAARKFSLERFSVDKMIDLYIKVFIDQTA